jgi:hypothetical protein
VWLCIADVYDDDADEARVSRNDLADLYGASPRAVRDVVAELVSRGLIVALAGKGRRPTYLIPGVTHPAKIQRAWPHAVKVAARPARFELATVTANVAGPPARSGGGTSRQVAVAEGGSTSRQEGGGTSRQVPRAPGEGTARGRGATPPPDPRRIGASADGVSEVIRSSAPTNDGQDDEQQQAISLAQDVEKRTGGYLSARRVLPAALEAMHAGLAHGDAAAAMTERLDRTGYATTRDLVAAVRERSQTVSPTTRRREMSDR